MPTGFLNNARLTMPGSTYDAASSVTGLCTGEATNLPQTAAADAYIAAWPTGMLAELDAQCASFSGTYTPASSAAALCGASGISMAAATTACARFQGSATPYAACLTDFCATVPNDDRTSWI
jgi:hypothetical protein